MENQSIISVSDFKIFCSQTFPSLSKLILKTRRFLVRTLWDSFRFFRFFSYILVKYLKLFLAESLHLKHAWFLILVYDILMLGFFVCIIFVMYIHVFSKVAR